jgi:hypothetical protein
MVQPDYSYLATRALLQKVLVFALISVMYTGSNSLRTEESGTDIKSVTGLCF